MSGGLLPVRLAKRLAKPAYRAGDVLKLRSGGRPMTATWSGPVLFAPGNWLICQWFSDAGELQQEMFAEETLERTDRAAPQSSTREQ
ncbi:YodC family protein [Paraburkholderia sediminicola]|uniref:YodC family protein n=1 Tax=Paraburkholderia rhynchosiae TaxID=487049 RepID=A0ACC7NE37_9BURK